MTVNANGGVEGAATASSERGNGGVGPGRSVTYSTQSQRPLRIILIRHGQSEGNVKRDVTQSTPDHLIHLTQQGREEALQTGRNLKSLVGEESIKFIVSPYVRTQETVAGIAHAFGGGRKLDISEDLFIREQDFGNFESGNMKELHKEKKAFGKFYYRFPEGESPADVYNRAGLFLESMYRRWEVKYVDNTVIVSHELFLKVFIMRMFRYPVKDYYNIRDLFNAEMIVLERGQDSLIYDIAYTWAPGKDKQTGGVKKRTDKPDQPITEIWDGDPDSPLLESKPAIDRTVSLKNGIES
jgi:broad specificity phosphatase PhoE